jgi:hypothetical protein
MAATRTLVVEARKALVELLQARPNLDGKQVVYGWPGVDNIDTECIYTGGRAQIDHEPAALMSGRLARKEVASFDVVIVTKVVGGTSLEADELAMELGQEVESVLAENRTLGVVGINWATIAPVSLTGFFNDQGFLAELTYTVRYSARLV